MFLLYIYICHKHRLNLGRLILSIATTTKITSTTNTTTLRLCEAFLVQRFSSDLYNLVRALLYSGTNPSSTSSSSTSRLLSLVHRCGVDSVLPHSCSTSRYVRTTSFLFFFFNFSKMQKRKNNVPKRNILGGPTAIFMFF